jgi:hypothetical protein
MKDYGGKNTSCASCGWSVWRDNRSVPDDECKFCRNCVNGNKWRLVDENGEDDCIDFDR